MHKRMTITLDADVYDGLNRMVGKRRISQFISDIVRPHVSDSALDAGYRDMASDEARENEAGEWIAALADDGADAAR
jgi:predicted CopG family antitoxin